MITDIKNYNVDLFLIDFELIGSGKNGLEIIEQGVINNKAILVTSCFEDKLVRIKCKSLGIKIIPKIYVPNIPIHIQASVMKPNYIFIDDDELIRQAWSYAAEEAGIQLDTFESPDQFNKYIDQYDKRTRIYIDSNLNQNLKGEQFAKILYASGFTEIYLATGYPASDFSQMPWIKAIIGKTPSFTDQGDKK